MSDFSAFFEQLEIIFEILKEFSKFCVLQNEDVKVQTEPWKLNCSSLCVTIPEILIIGVLAFIMWFCLSKICSLSVFVVVLFTLFLSLQIILLYFSILLFFITVLRVFTKNGLMFMQSCLNGDLSGKRIDHV